MSLMPLASRMLAQATPAAPAPEMTTRSEVHVAVEHLRRAQQRGEHDDRGAVLVVVHDRAVQRLDDAALDLEAARRRDVLEVDRAERRAQPHQGLDDLVGILGVEHDRDRVQPAERLEQRALALHHRQRRRRADVAEAEHRGAVADHGDQPVGPGVLGGQRVIGGDRAADLGDARGVGDRQRPLGVQRRLQLDRELAALVGGEDLRIIDDDLGVCAPFRGHDAPRRHFTATPHRAGFPTREAVTEACQALGVAFYHRGPRGSRRRRKEVRACRRFAPCSRRCSVATRRRRPTRERQRHSRARRAGDGRLRRLRRRQPTAGQVHPRRRADQGARTRAGRQRSLRLDRPARTRRTPDAGRRRRVRPARTGRRGRRARPPAAEAGALRRNAVPGAQDRELRRARIGGHGPRDRRDRRDHDLRRTRLRRHRAPRRAQRAGRRAQAAGRLAGDLASWAPTR